MAAAAIYQPPAGKQIYGFWRPAGARRHYSQWYASKFTMNGIEYGCAEQAMMHAKALLFDDAEIARRIMATRDAREHRNLGRRVRNFSEDTWNANKYRIVVDISRAKFSQNDELKNILLATGDAVLVELSPYDGVWGVKSSSVNPARWRGQNLLGRALMEVREELAP